MTYCKLCKKKHDPDKEFDGLCGCTYIHKDGKSTLVKSCMDYLITHKAEITGPFPMFNPFEDILEEIRNLYNKHYPKKGDSWKKLPINVLWDKLEEEYNELKMTFEDKRYEELLDLILVALMLAKRLKKEE